MKTDSRTMPVLLTYDDYCLIPDDGKRHEIIHGEHYVSPAPGYKHQRIIGNLYFLIEQFLRSNKVGRIMLSPFDVVLSNHSVVQPDLLFVASKNSEVITSKNAQGSPDLVIEILSKGNRRHDELTKRELYEQFGVNEYWIIDPEKETIKMYRLRSTAFQQPHLYTLGQQAFIETPLLAGLQLKLDDIFDVA